MKHLLCWLFGHKPSTLVEDIEFAHDLTLHTWWCERCERHLFEERGRLR